MQLILRIFLHMPTWAHRHTLFNLIKYFRERQLILNIRSKTNNRHSVEDAGDGHGKTAVVQVCRYCVKG